MTLNKRGYIVYLHIQKKPSQRSSQDFSNYLSNLLCFLAICCHLQKSSSSWFFFSFFFSFFILFFLVSSGQVGGYRECCLNWSLFSYSFLQDSTKPIKSDDQAVFVLYFSHKLLQIKKNRCCLNVFDHRPSIFKRKVFCALGERQSRTVG